MKIIEYHFTFPNRTDALEIAYIARFNLNLPYWGGVTKLDGPVIIFTRIKEF